MRKGRWAAENPSCDRWHAWLKADSEKLLRERLRHFLTSRYRRGASVQILEVIH